MCIEVYQRRYFNCAAVVLPLLYRSNPMTLYGLVISLVVIIGIVYIPGLHGIFATRSLTGIGARRAALTHHALKYQRGT